MRTVLNSIAVATALFCLMQPGQALSQSSTDQLPWLHNSTGQSGQAPNSGTNTSQSNQLPWLKSSPHSHTSSSKSSAAKSSTAKTSSLKKRDSSSTREADDRKLDLLATEYYHISTKDDKAGKKIEDLQKRVKAFHAELKKRSYDVADIIKDTVSLENRISATQKKLAKNDAADKATASPSAK